MAWLLWVVCMAPSPLWGEGWGEGLGLRVR
jgi:hypothetical protein